MRPAVVINQEQKQSYANDICITAANTFAPLATAENLCFEFLDGFKPVVIELPSKQLLFLIILNCTRTTYCSRVLCPLLKLEFSILLSASIVTSVFISVPLYDFYIIIII